MSDRLSRAYARLKALRSHVNDHNVPETYVLEYHEILDQIEATGINLKEFRVGAHHVKPIVTSRSLMGGATRYSGTKFVSGNFFRSKLDAVLTYFSLGTSKDEKSREVGFITPEAS